MIAALALGSMLVVRAWKAAHPGSMTVIESQAMDMTAMKPPVGAVPVATEIVRPREFSATVTYTGSVAPYNEQVVYARVEGLLKSLSVYDGDRVSAGQLLAELDSPDLRSRAAEAAAGLTVAAEEVPAARHGANRAAADKAAAASEMEAAKSVLARARAAAAAARQVVTQREEGVRSARADLDYWEVEIRRQENLLKSGAVSRQEYDSDKARAVSAEAALKSAEAALRESRAGVQAAEAEVAAQEAMARAAGQRASAAASAALDAEQQVRKQSAATRQAAAAAEAAAAVDSYRFVRAPFAGLVTRRYVSPGQFVTPSTAITHIVQIDRVRLQANVADSDAGAVRVGARIRARFARDPQLVINAAVTSVSPLADQTTRTVIVEAIAPNPGLRLSPGDAVTMEISVGEREEAISVPTSAVVRKDGRPAVWVAREEAARGKMTYYCTMHPEVVSQQPGDCPKCLMKLVPRESEGGKRAHLIMVSTGRTGAGRVEILSGLSAGDEVIYRGNTYLKEGDTVSPVRWTADGPAELPRAPGADHSPHNGGSHQRGGGH